MKKALLSPVVLSLAVLSLAAAAPAQIVRKPAEPPLVINDPVPAPDAVVRELYKVHRDGLGRVFERQGRRLQLRFFDAKLAALLWKNLTEAPEGEAGRIDFDPLYNAQETQIKNFNVGAGSVEGDTATVPVTFLNFNKKVTITYRLVKTSAGWKISNIVYDEDSDFLKILTMPLG